MRLKILRKERPALETEGAIINGNRMDLSSNVLKPAKHRSNTSFALPTSLNTELSPIIISSSNQTHEKSPRSRQKTAISKASQPSNISCYQAIEAAYLEHGIRIRLSPTRTAATTSGQQSGNKSPNNFQRHTAFASRNPSRTSSVLQYATTNQNQHQQSRPFSALQQTSSNDFQQTDTHNVSFTQSSQTNEETQNVCYPQPSQINEEIHNDYHSPSIILSEQSNPITSPEKLPVTTDITSIKPLFDNDPDLAYMSSLLKKTSVDSFRDTIRRRSGLRGTFGVYRHPLIANPIQSQPQSREKSPIMNRNPLVRDVTSATVSVSSAKKIDKDILKHASRIRRSSQSKDYLIKSLKTDTIPIVSPPPKTNNNNNNKRNSINKPLKSISLEPLKFLLSRAPRSASLLGRDLPSIKNSSPIHNLKIPAKRTKSAKIPPIENQNTNNFLLKEHTTSPAILRDESLSLMKTSPLDTEHQTNSFDSGCYDRSSSGGDAQSLTSSSIIQIQSSIPSARLANSAVRRPNTNKKVSFYEEPTAVILTTATYV